MNRILIIANDPLVRAGMATLLANQNECAVVGQMSDDENIADALNVYRPDVIVWDWREPVDLREISTPVIALLPDANAARAAWSSGARGVLMRSASGATMAATVGAVTQGLIALDPALAASVLPTRELSRNVLVEELTPRELQVLRALAQGQSNKEIARALGISEHTIKFHINAILGKLNAQSRTEAVVIATRLGLILL
jgi:two-component system, NarL family, nitrate/nitrite response regulator NarL